MYGRSPSYLYYFTRIINSIYLPFWLVRGKDLHRNYRLLSTEIVEECCVELLVFLIEHILRKGGLLKKKTKLGVSSLILRHIWVFWGTRPIRKDEGHGLYLIGLSRATQI